MATDRRAQTSKNDITGAAAQQLLGLARHDSSVLEGLLEMQVENMKKSGLDPVTHALVRLAALVAIDAAPASFLWQIGIARETGVTPEDIVGMLVAIAPSIGMARIVATAPEIAYALGLDLEPSHDGEVREDVKVEEKVARS
jgi:alkylhydroperoxidase/carboxymuconolactone decarboxylase family protein YurZ